MTLMGGDIAAMLIHCVLWLVVLALIECGAFRWLLKAPLVLSKNRIAPKVGIELDDDVLKEEIKANEEQLPVRVSGFRKVYHSVFRNPVVAVERTSFCLDYGECFALLGVNGAGKTTTFKALTMNDNSLETG